MHQIPLTLIWDHLKEYDKLIHSIIEAIDSCFYGNYFLPQISHLIELLYDKGVSVGPLCTAVSQLIFFKLDTQSSTKQLEENSLMKKVFSIIEQSEYFSIRTPSYKQTYTLLQIVKPLLLSNVLQNKKIARSICSLLRQFHGRIDDKLGLFLDRSLVITLLIR